MDNIADKVKGKVDILVNNAGMLDKEPILQGVVTVKPVSCRKAKLLRGWQRGTHSKRSYQTACSPSQSELPVQ